MKDADLSEVLWAVVWCVVVLSVNSGRSPRDIPKQIYEQLKTRLHACFEVKQWNLNLTV